MYQKHGLKKHLLYTVWVRIKQCCYNKNNKDYSHYGGRGIDVYSLWRNNFKLFYDFCIANGWEKGLEIDRRNNDLGYFPFNCRFVTRKKNNQNANRSKVWHVKGKVFNSSQDAADFFGAGRRTIMDWCNGYKSNGHAYPPKSKCWSELRYKKI